MNIFKNKNEKNVEFVAEVAVAKPSLDEQLHDDIYSAQEALLEEALRIINAPLMYNNENTERLRKLHALGFTGTGNVKQQKEADDERLVHAKMKATLDYYQKYYPFHRYINSEAVRNVCEKYGLILTEVSDYVADIPIKNQDEIINFRIVRQDTREPNEVTGNNRGFIGNGTSNPYSDNYYEVMEKKQKGFTREKIEGRELLIMAPIDKLKFIGKTVEGHIAKKLKDPIVLQAVRGRNTNGDYDYADYNHKIKGYLIVTSWGLEASDPAVTNAINN